MKLLFIKLVSLLVILSLILGGCSLNRFNSKSTQKGTVFMWEVTSKVGDGKLYLMGSIHVGKEDLYPLNPMIMNAFEKSDVLAVECDVTTVLQRPDYMQLMEKAMYTDNTTIKDHISDDLYQKVDTIFSENGIPLNLVSKYKPFFLAAMIASFLMTEWGYNPDDGVDVHLINQARDKGMAIEEIESVDFQYDLLGGFSDEIQLLELKSAVECVEASKNYLDEMFTYWLAGDVPSFEKLMIEEDDSLTPDEKAAYEDYEKQMFDDRNINMAAKAEEYLKSGKTYFFLVGSGHMVGDTGIVKLLSDKGYQVVQK